MNLLVFSLFCVVTTLALPKPRNTWDEASECDSTKCKLPKCHCSELEAPIAGKIPQFVALSFDDSATELIFDTFYKPVLFNRKNPDNCPISGTFFVPHEYTDYRVVNKLFNKGFEIGSHSVTKNYLIEYWKKASKEVITAEMGDQRKIIAQYANIPMSNISGARIPSFQLNGDNTYQGLKEAGFLYDNSWGSYNLDPYFPYTLDYASQQGCPIGTCPTASIPGFWVKPIVNWVNQNNEQCNKLLACNVQGTEGELLEWMKENFLNHYNGNRAPFSLIVNSAWFTYTENSLEAFKKFLDYLSGLKDVFIVSEKQVLDWAKNPVTVDKYKSCGTKQPVASCKPIICKLKNANQEDRYMGSCVKCPKKYPALHNPAGK